MESQVTTPTRPYRQVCALYDKATLTVFQAYSQEIADSALTAGTFTAPFKFNRMTWIKPSFLWMMYRSAWAMKPGQERILGIRIYRDAFDSALTSACLSYYDSELYPTYEQWRRLLRTSTVRVQWDPERSIHGQALPWRTIQVGLSGASVRHYASDWISRIDDWTGTVHRLRQLVNSGRPEALQQHLPTEDPYPLPSSAIRAIGIH